MRRRGVRSDNILLVPANMLPSKGKWQRLANSLPEGDALLVVPKGDGRLRRPLRSIAIQLRKRGHRVVTVASDDHRSIISL